MMNPPDPEGTITPSTRTHIPGVVTRKLNVVRNIAIAAMLPSADSLADKGRRPIRSAMEISAAPIQRLPPGHR